MNDRAASGAATAAASVPAGPDESAAIISILLLVPKGKEDEPRG